MFDEQPDGDPHGECAAEIHRLQGLLAALVVNVNKALAETIAGAEECRGKPGFAGVRPEWDDGYIQGIKVCGMIVQAAMLTAC